MINPYRAGIWDGTSKEVEMDDRHEGWKAGFEGGMIRACRSKAYSAAMVEGRLARHAESQSSVLAESH